MIASLTGTVQAIAERSIVLDVSGVGYLVYTPARLLDTLRIDQHACLQTHLVVREQAMDLYGFGTSGEVIFFQKLLNVSGIGPRSALGIIDLGDPVDLANAITRGDATYLTQVSGVGKKSAERIIIELQDKLGDLASQSAGTAAGGDLEVIEALIAMGYMQQQARDAVRTLDPDLEETSKRIAEALRALA